jgi:vacuolar-type H+-ATPase subunit F/Vma7
MTSSSDHLAQTRMIFMGEAPLTDGFRLIGFETIADPPAEQVEKLLRELVNKRQNAFIIIDQRLAEADLPALNRVRAEGGHIVVAVVPPLNRPDSFRLAIDDRLQVMLGASNFQKQDAI